MMNYLYHYQKSKDLVKEFEEDCLRQTKPDEESGASHQTGHVSNPTMRGAMMLLNPPKHIVLARKWVKVIDRVWDEVKEEDMVENRENGIAYLFENAYCLTGKPRAKEANAENRARICEECGIAQRTFYTWLNRCVNTTTYYAAKEGLI